MDATHRGVAGRAGPIVGIPRALTFFKQAAMWVVFLESLGARVILSKATNRGIVEDGLKLSVDESCLPAKVYLGHVQDLIQRNPDYIFVVRQQDFNADEVLCTKLWGIPDICRNTFELPEGCNWLELNISPSVDRITPFKAWYRTGRTLTRNTFRIIAAYFRASRAQHRYESWLRCGREPQDALKLAREGRRPGADDQQVNPPEAKLIRIALLGHSYLVHDEHFGRPIIRLLEQLGAEVRCVEHLDSKRCLSAGRNVSPGLYWKYNCEIVGAADCYIRDNIDGAILVEAFPCGPDALALEMAVRKLRGRAPMIRLVLDELQALSGVKTRLESFIDVIQLRRLEVADA